jgi:hypothetical protein
MNRKRSSLLWLVAAAIIIGALIYLEQIAVLYVLATFAIVALLVIVSVTNLEDVGRSE